MVPYSHNEELFHRFEMKRNMSPYRRETDRRHCLSFDTLYGRFLADNKNETFLPPMSKRAFGALLNHFGYYRSHNAHDRYSYAVFTPYIDFVSEQEDLRELYEYLNEHL